MDVHLAKMSTTSRINPLLKLAVLGGVRSAVEIQLRREPDLNARDDTGRTLLMLAAAKGHAEISLLLLHAGADLLATDHAGRNAVSIARAAGFSSLASLLEGRLPNSGNNASADAHLIEPGFPKTADAESGIQPSEWEADEPPPMPPSDDSCLGAAVAQQLEISYFVPVDTAEDWADVRIKLPDITRRRRRRARFAKHQTRAVSRLFREGVREGCVPRWRLDETILEINGEYNEVLQVQLRVVLDDLGVVIDEYDDWDWHSLRNGTKLTTHEKRLVRAAVHFFVDLASPRLDPLDLYYRDVSVSKFLSHEEEIELGEAKHHAIEAAMAAVAQSESALADLLHAADLVNLGEIPLRRISNPNSSLAADSSDSTETDASLEPSQDGFPATSLGTTIGEFSEIVLEIRRLVSEWPPAEPSELGELLRALHLSWGFISHLSKKDHQLGRASSEPCPLYAAVRKGNEARSRLAVSNLRLVISIAKSFWHHGFPLLDLIQEGNIGLLRAVDKYDHRLGFRFSTYATWWIRQFMQRAICDQSRLIRVPAHIADMIRRTERMSATLGGISDISTIAAHLGVSVEKVERALEARREILALDEGTTSDHTHLEFNQIDADSPEDLVMQSCLRDDISSLLVGLAPRDRDILRLRFGLDDEREHTLEEVGARFEVTRERIRQIEKRVLKNLSESPATQKLRDYLDEDTSVNNVPQFAEVEATDAS
jgi:RNA polymerase primary sigma factor